MASEPLSETTLGLLEEIAKLSDGLTSGHARARDGLLAACANLTAELSHPSETMIQQLWAQPAHVNILWIAVKVKLFQAMETLPDTGASVTEIANRCDQGVEPVLVGRMLRHLAAMSTVRETAPDNFAPTRTSAAYARSEYQDCILYIADNWQPVHQALPSYFEQNGFRSPDSGTDGPFQHAYDCKGSHYFEYFQKFNPEMGRRFASMMATWSKGRPKWYDEAYYPVKQRLINGADIGAPFLIDIGGGSGHDAVGLQQAFGELLPGKIVLQDRPEIIEIANVGSDVEKMAHDFLTEQPVKGARAYYLHSIIQDWNNGVNTQILKAIIPAMKRGYSRVIVNDFVVPNQGAHWAQTCLDWELMASLGSRHRTEAQHRELYESAGLTITGMWRHPQSLDTLIELELV